MIRVDPGTLFPGHFRHSLRLDFGFGSGSLRTPLVHGPPVSKPSKSSSDLDPADPTAVGGPAGGTFGAASLARAAAEGPNGSDYRPGNTVDRLQNVREPFTDAEWAKLV